MATKTNIEYLKDAIAKGRFEEVDEWIDAIENELKENNDSEEVQRLESELDDKEKEIERLQEEVDGFEDWINPEELEEIDCGIGVIKYLPPDNLKLQMRMESLKEKMEFGALH